MGVPMDWVGCSPLSVDAEIAMQAWRDKLNERQQADFEILDADGGKGWDLLQQLITKREKRITVGQAKGHPFAR